MGMKGLDGMGFSGDVSIPSVSGDHFHLLLKRLRTTKLTPSTSQVQFLRRNKPFPLEMGPLRLHRNR